MVILQAYHNALLVVHYHLREYIGVEVPVLA
jgi:hypothetical protein